MAGLVAGVAAFRQKLGDVLAGRLGGFVQRLNLIMGDRVIAGDILNHPVTNDLKPGLLGFAMKVTHRNEGHFVLDKD